MIDEATIEEVGRRIGAAAPEGSRVILFGSHARGEANSHSDVDILVIEPEVENATEESVRLYRTLKDLRIPVDVLVVYRGKARGEQRSKGRWSSEPSERGAILSPEHREYAELLLQKARDELGAAQTLIATEDSAAQSSASYCNRRSRRR